jgi:hypothetical protein
MSQLRRSFLHFFFLSGRPVKPKLNALFAVRTSPAPPIESFLPSVAARPSARIDTGVPLST